MRILQISSAQSLGGGERHLADLSNALALRGHDVYVALRLNSPIASHLNEVPKKNIKVLPLRNALDVETAHQLSRLVRENKIEIVHAHMARDYPPAAYATRLNPRSRLIITRHVLFPMNRLHKITLFRAARIIAVSEAVALQIRAQKIVSHAKITVVHNGVKTDHFAREQADFDRTLFCRNWVLPEESLLVGTVGELKQLKGQVEFLQAAAIIAAALPDARFIIAGQDTSAGGEERASLERLISQLGLAERVLLVGWLDNVAELLCALDVFVSASRTESFGLAIAEAMACGTAVVATETDGAREVIEDGKTGVLLPVGDVDRLAATVITLLQDKQSREELGKRAQEAVRERFSLERMVEATEKIYQQSL